MSTKRRVRLFCCIYFAAVLAVQSRSVAQTTPVSLSGTVVDDVTGAPLEFVDVFLESTLKGTSTSTDGSFNLSDIPPGRYELVASRVGYERFSRTITLPEVAGSPIRISLTPKMLGVGNVDVVAKDPEEWKELLEQFEWELLGGTASADRCVLLNPEVMSLERPAKGALVARTDKPLQVENHALGFRLTVYLHDFMLNRQGLRSSWNIRFEALAAEDEDQREDWEEARDYAYRGSFRHFLRSIVQRRSREEGFRLFVVPGMGKSRRNLGTVVSESEILWDAGVDGSLKQLRFNDFLEVRYVRNPIRLSFIKLEQMGVRLTGRGELLNPNEVTVYGSWSEQRLADAVPIEIGLDTLRYGPMTPVVTQSSLRGVALDAVTKEPIPLVNVVVRGTWTGAVTDENGEFFIEGLPGDSCLVAVSHIGYEKLLLAYKNDPPAAHQDTFLLNQSLVMLPEVVVEGTKAFAERSPTYLINHEELERLGYDDMEHAMRYLLMDLVRPADVRMRFPEQDFTLYINDEWRESAFLATVDPFSVLRIAVWAPWSPGGNSRMDISQTTPIRYPLRRGRFVLAVWTEEYGRQERQ